MKAPHPAGDAFEYTDDSQLPASAVPTVAFPRGFFGNRFAFTGRSLFLVILSEAKNL